MDQKTFRSLVEQVAQVKEGTGKGLGGRKPRPKRIVVTEIDEFGEEVEVEVIESGSNETLPFQITKLKPVSALCIIGCGRIVEDQVVHKKLHPNPQPHWRTHCVKCQIWLGPNNELLKGSIAAHHAFSARFNPDRDK